MKRRQRKEREPIASGEMRNVTFRVSAEAYNHLIALAAAAGTSVSHVGERLILGAEKPSPADDLRQIIREEIRAAFDIKDARAIGSSLSVSKGAVPTVAGFDQACREVRSIHHHPV